MRAKRRLRTVAATLVLSALLTHALPAADSRAALSDMPFTEAVARTAPFLVLNTVPGFGVGSYLQGDWGSGLILTAADLVAAGLIVPATIYLNANPDDDTGGEYVLALLGGYGVFLASKVGGTVYPIVDAVRNGVDTSSLVAPIVYNTFPGFGLGSALQGDELGATIVAGLDLTAFVALGVLSFTALGGAEEAAAVAGITMATAYGFGRLAGVTLPVVYRLSGATAR